jgi:hypothetical protein
MQPVHECVNNISEPTEQFMGSPFECLLFKCLDGEIGYHWKQQKVHNHSISLFIELPVETEKR